MVVPEVPAEAVVVVAVGGVSGVESLPVTWTTAGVEEWGREVESP